MRRLAERLAGRDDRDDVLQEALLAAWSKRESYNVSRGTVQSWLLGIVANQARKSTRGRRRSYPLNDLDGGGTTGPAVHVRLDVDRAIVRLASRQRMAVELFYFVGLSVREVADVMGIAEGTAKSTLADARERLRSYLRDDYK